MNFSERRFFLHSLHGLRLRGVGLRDHTAAAQRICIRFYNVGAASRRTCCSRAGAIACTIARRIRIDRCGLCFRKPCLLTRRRRPQHRLLHCARLQLRRTGTGSQPRTRNSGVTSPRPLIHVPPAAPRQRQDSRRDPRKKHPIPGLLLRTVPAPLRLLEWQSASKPRNPRFGCPLFFLRGRKRRDQFLQLRLFRAALGFLSKSQFLRRRRRRSIVGQRRQPRRNFHLLLLQQIQSRDRRDRRLNLYRLVRLRHLRQNRRRVRRLGVFHQLYSAFVNQLRFQRLNRLLAQRKRGNLHLRRDSLLGLRLFCFKLFCFRLRRRTPRGFRKLHLRQFVLQPRGLLLQFFRSGVTCSGRLRRRHWRLHGRGLHFEEWRQARQVDTCEI